MEIAEGFLSFRHFVLAERVFYLLRILYNAFVSCERIDKYVQDQVHGLLYIFFRSTEWPNMNRLTEKFVERRTKNFLLVSASSLRQYTQGEQDSIPIFWVFLAIVCERMPRDEYLDEYLFNSMILFCIWARDTLLAPFERFSQNSNCGFVLIVWPLIKPAQLALNIQSLRKHNFKWETVNIKIANSETEMSIFGRCDQMV